MTPDALFRPFHCRSLTLKNRIVMAPMTRGFAPDAVPGPDIAAYYRRRAEGGVGLILSEGTLIDRPAAGNRPGVPAFHGEGALEGWGRVLSAVQDADGCMAPQLWHVGAHPDSRFPVDPALTPESPSGLYGAGLESGRGMSDSDIADAIAAFASAAASAARLGFDAIEIHGAHGYLVDQFFWNETNRRGDAFGGPDMAQRVKFACDTVRAVREAVGDAMPVILRISQWKQVDYTARLAKTPQEMERWLVPLADAGVDIFHCSQRRFWEAEFPEVDGPAGLNCAGWAKKVTGCPTITVGSVGLTGDASAAYAGESSRPASLDALIERLEREEFDLVAVGRALLADPAWASKIRRQRTDELIGFDPQAFAILH